MPVPVIVLNFGHSVLRTLDDYTNAASEIYRHYRKGQNVVAVTSAQHDQTDILMAEARKVGPEGTARNLAELVHLGERRSAALLALALERIGAPAFVRQARDLGLKAEGSTTEASLVGLNKAQLEEDLKNHDIVVMPGYVGIGDNDRPVLLSDGGADLSAIYVAHQLGVKAILIKDVDGVYEHDPREAGPAPKRYPAISWDDAQKRARVLIAPKALDYAKTHKLEFDVGGLGQADYTTIGAKTDAPIVPKKLTSKRVVMMGCGVVGGGILRRIETMPNRFTMEKIMVRNVQKYIEQGINPDLLTDDFDDLLAAEPDIFIDVSGPIDPGLDFTRRMLARGVHVVSANKQAIAAGGQDLINFASDNSALLTFSSAAGGGMPVLEMCLREAGRITKVEALLNGTTNYMLGEISSGTSYADALKAAQDKGFAEADPSADVDGDDAAAKIRLVALLGFGQLINSNDIPKQSIRDFTLDGTPKGAMKRIATCWLDSGVFKTSLDVRDVPLDDFMAQADGEEAHAVFTFTDGDQYRIRGKGAGRWPTTESAMADMFDISNADM
ncbi:homoserine dehydrogenase [Fretibacter rubidus]|uniref:amino acid kinase family protein n=1 Tax=Fretibacter rubidus TaxID=570162 RepID=UPI00352A5963